VKAKCPYCSAGCDRCSGGTIEVSFPTGPEYQRWAKICQGCGAVAGGCFSGLDLPEPFVDKYTVCPACGGKNIRLEPA
jgi:hypothetical protein